MLYRNESVLILLLSLTFHLSQVLTGAGAAAAGAPPEI